MSNPTTAYSHSSKPPSQNELPWLVFKLKDSAYTINSRIVTSILRMPDEITPVAGSTHFFRGLFNYRNVVLPLLDMRLFFGLKSLESEHKEQETAIDRIKAAHINWVDALESSIRDSVPFSKTFDPHACELGKWIDSVALSGDVSSIIGTSFAGITEAHGVLHTSGKALLERSVKLSVDERRLLSESPDFIKLRSLSKTIVEKLTQMFNSIINANREMIIFLSDGNCELGIIVDEIVTVDSLTIVSTEEKFPTFQKTKFFNGVAESKKISGEILLVNEPLLLSTLKDLDRTA